MKDNDILHFFFADIDAIELRVDLLESTELANVREQIAVLRHSTHLPIIFTVRSQNQGGKFINDEDSIFELLECGKRAGCDILDIEVIFWSNLVFFFFFWII